MTARPKTYTITASPPEDHGLHVWKPDPDHPGIEVWGGHRLIVNKLEWRVFADAVIADLVEKGWRDIRLFEEGVWNFKTELPTGVSA